MRPLAALAALAVATPLLALAAPEVEAASRLDSVTVFRSSARVVRVLRVEVGAGASRVALPGLPAELDDDSIRVEGRGGGRVEIHGVTVERVRRERAVASEARAAEERLEGLQDEDRELQDRVKAAQGRATFVESLRSTYSEERSRNLAVRPLSAKEWAEAASFVERQLADAAGAVRQAEAARRELRRRIEQARAALDQLAAKRGETTKRVAIEVTASRPGAIELAVAYSVPSAGWEPVWDVRLDAPRSSVELAFYGSIWQRTGEDWSDVRLAVSTTVPGRGLSVPELAPRWLDRAAAMRSQPMEAFAPRVASKAIRPSSAPRADAEVAGEQLVAAEEPQAAVETGLLATTFTAPGRESVDGAGQARKIALARFPLQAELGRTAAPRLDRAAYLTAKVVNATGFPILPGTAGLYVGDQFVGRAALRSTPAGGELQLAFGADDRIEIERRVLERKHDTSGLLDKKDVWRYRVRISVKSRWDEPVRLTLLDLLPVARDASIEVAVLDGSTRPTREDPERPGVRAWELELKPRQEQVVELRYEVRHPRGAAIAGLE
jgi:uncharacterized protein (TIGR02231 family)